MPSIAAEKIMIIRHAEKPDAVNQGVTESGVESKHDLSVRGWQRAGALACFFARGPIAQPQFLFASAVKDGTAEGARSKRAFETLLPLSRRLHIEINLSFTKGQEQQVAAAAQACPGVVLIAWQHEGINAIVRALPGGHQALPNWLPQRFDVVYVLDFDAAAGTYRFAQVPQCLLDGDVDQPIL
jgi:hypothetical protein